MRQFRCGECGVLFEMRSGQTAVPVEQDRLEDEVSRLAAQNDRYEKCLRTILEWDQLNPPARFTDFPWLRKLVEDALAGQFTSPARGERP